MSSVPNSGLWMRSPVKNQGNPRKSEPPWSATLRLSTEDATIFEPANFFCGFLCEIGTACVTCAAVTSFFPTRIASVIPYFFPVGSLVITNSSPSLFLIWVTCSVTGLVSSAKSPISWIVNQLKKQCHPDDKTPRATVNPLHWRKPL